MEILRYVVIVTNLIGLSVQALTVDIKQEELLKKNLEPCKKLAKNPYFETELVLGRPWRIYHTWNLKLDTICVDVTFKKATRTIIHRVWSDMSDYLVQQPYWDSAALLLTWGAAEQELLLFPAQGVAGGFSAVPNIIRSDITPMRNAVPLFPFQLKLVNHGKFLVIMDCNHVGAIYFAARVSHPPNRSEIAAAVAELNIDEGFPACIQEKNKEKQFFEK